MHSDEFSGSLNLLQAQIYLHSVQPFLKAMSGQQLLPPHKKTQEVSLHSAFSVSLISSILCDQIPVY